MNKVCKGVGLLFLGFLGLGAVGSALGPSKEEVLDKHKAALTALDSDLKTIHDALSAGVAGGGRQLPDLVLGEDRQDANADIVRYEHLLAPKVEPAHELPYEGCVTAARAWARGGDGGFLDTPSRMDDKISRAAAMRYVIVVRQTRFVAPVLGTDVFSNGEWALDGFVFDRTDGSCKGRFTVYAENSDEVEWGHSRYSSGQSEGQRALGRDLKKNMAIALARSIRNATGGTVEI